MKRRRNRFTSVSRRVERYQRIEEHPRSRFVKISTPFVSDVKERHVGTSTRVRPRLRSVQIGRNIPVTTKSAIAHGGFVSAKRCVAEKLKEFKDTRGSGTGKRKSYVREVSRRRLFIAARSKC